MIKIFFILALIIGGASTSIAKASFDASFRCSKASTSIEHLICSDKQLAADDKKMAVMYKDLQQRITFEGKQLLRDNQRFWLKKRLDGCENTKACIKKKYDDRNSQIKIAISLNSALPSVEYLMKLGFASHVNPQLIHYATNWGTLPPKYKKMHPTFVVPFLMERMRKKKSYPAARSIGEILQEKGKDVFAELLQYGDEWQRSAVVGAAYVLPGADSDSFVLQGLADQSVNVRKRAAYSISFMCSTEKIDFKVLLEDSSEEVRINLVRELRGMQYRDELTAEEIDVLIKTANDESQKVSEIAKNTLESMKNHSFPHAAKPFVYYDRKLRLGLPHEKISLREKATTEQKEIESLFISGQWDELVAMREKSILVLVDMLKAEGQKVIREARVIDRVGNGDIGYVREIARDLARSDGVMSTDGVAVNITRLQKLISVLSYIGKDTIVYLNRNIREYLVSDNKRDYFGYVEPALLIRVMGEVGDYKAVDHLIEYTKSHIPVVVQVSLRSLAMNIDRRVEPVFKKALKHSSSDVRKTAALALREFGWVPENIQEEISFWIASSNWHKVSCKGKPAIKQLIEMLKIDNGSQRRNLPQTLQNITGVSFGEDQAAWQHWWEAQNTH